MILLAPKRLAGVTPKVNPREHITCTPLQSANKAAHSGFETQRRCHQKSKNKAIVGPDSLPSTCKQALVGLKTDIGHATDHSVRPGRQILYPTELCPLKFKICHDQNNVH